MQRDAYHYDRFSSPKQAKGFSKERQSDRFTYLCQKHGWTPDTTLNISDYGRSAYRGDEQRGLKLFRDAIKEGRVKPGRSVLVIEKLDRLTRKNVRKALKLFLEIIEAGVWIATFDPETIHTEESTNDLVGLIYPLAEFAANHEKSRQLSKTIKDNMNRKREKLAQGKILTKRCPAWCQYNPETGRFDPIDEKAKWVWQIVRWSADGYGARLITKKLNSEGVVNIAYGTCKKCKKRWTQRYVEEILHDRRVLGEYHPRELKDEKRVRVGDLPIKGYFPRVVTDDLWYEHVAEMDKRKKVKGQRGEGVSSLFTGILYDARNHSTVRLVNSSASEKKAGCMRRLASYHSDLGADDFLSWRYEHFEEAFLHFLRREFRARLLVPAQNEEDRLPGLNAKLAAIEGNIAATQERSIGKPDVRPFLDLLEWQDEERKAVAAEIEAEKVRQAGQRSALEGELVSVLDLLEKADVKERERLRTKLKALIRQAVREVWMLIEIGEHRLDRTCTVQVFMSKGRMYLYRLHRKGRKLWWSGVESGEICHPHALPDLRKWWNSERTAGVSGSGG